MKCPEVEHLADLNLDGEVEGPERAEFEAHLAACPPCRRTFQGRAHVQSCIKERLQTAADVPASENLRAQVCQKLRVADHTAPTRLPFRRALPATLAVGTLFILSWSLAKRPSLDPEEPVAHHSRNLPPEVRNTSGDEVDRLFERNLRYPVRVPRFRRAGQRRGDVQLVGARLSNIANRDAAYVMYDDHGARISLFAVPSDGRFEMPETFSRRVVHGIPVRIGEHRGYNVVAWEQGKLMYALVSSVDPDVLVKFVGQVGH